MATYLDFPFRIDGRGRTALTDEDDHIRDMIHQVLFTSPGERVNRPEFGCGVKALLFMPNRDALAAATKVLIKGALQKWLEREIQVDDVNVVSNDSRLEITVVYTKRSSGERRADIFEGPA